MGVGSKISGGEKKGAERGQLEGLHSPPVQGACSTAARGGRRSEFAQALPCRKTKTSLPAFGAEAPRVPSPAQPAAAPRCRCHRCHEGSRGSVPRAAGKPQGARGCEALGKNQKFSKRRQQSPRQEPRAASEGYMRSFAAPLRPQGSEQGGGFALCHGMRSEHRPWRPL